MLTANLDKLPAGLRREIELNPDLFATDLDVMHALQFAESRDLQQEFRANLPDYLGFCRAHAAGAKTVGWKFAPMPPAPAIQPRPASTPRPPPPPIPRAASRVEYGRATCTAIPLFPVKRARQ